MTNSVPFESLTDFEAAVEHARSAAAAYYDTDTQVMSDADYDAIIDRIEATVAIHPEWDDAGLLDSVAGGQSAGGDVTHPVPMLSLAKAKELEDVESFLATVNGVVVVEPKYDGLAVRAVYEGGRLVLVATRGDGTTGENVTAQAKSIQGLPAVLASAVDVEVRGEVYMTDADFEVANSNRVASGKPAFVNPRNATAGVLRKSDIEYHAPMSFGLYDVIGDGFSSEDSYLARVAQARALGIGNSVAIESVSADNGQGVRDIIAAIGERRATLGFPIDGAVVKADSMIERARLGAISRTPKWAVAYKYAADVTTTVLKDIEIAVGRTGRISLRAVLEPVFVGGTTITYATMHNPKFVTDADFRLGDTVYVYRAGDVIPRVNAVDFSKRPDSAVRWVAPEGCPDCGEAWDKSSLLWRCQTPECSTVGRIEYAASRDVLDIEGLSSAMATALVETGRVNDIADLFTLNVADIAALPVGDGSRLVGEKVAEKIIDGIQKAKGQSLARVITALGIRKTGRTMGRRLAAHFNSLKALRAASIADLTAVEGIGSEKAAYIHAGLASMSDVMDRLEGFGVTVSQDAPAAVSTSALPLAGLKVVVTGSVPGLSRGEANEAVEALGGASTGSVSKSTDLVVVGDGAGSKAEKAEALGVKIMSAEDFAALFAAHSA
jgi:DNA ligase (NAD+)